MTKAFVGVMIVVALFVAGASSGQVAFTSSAYADCGGGE